MLFTLPRGIRWQANRLCTSYVVTSLGDVNLADVCILYARADASDIPSAIESALAEFDLSVWWDKEIFEGDYRQVLKEEIESAGCVVPIWSKAAPDSAHLPDELAIAKIQGVPIVPIRIHSGPAPMGFGTLQATDVLGWKGELDHEQLPAFLLRVRKTLEKRVKVKRAEQLGGRDNRTLPMFFYSVSSYETKLLPPAALLALDVFGAQSILVSAYDTIPKGKTAKQRKAEEVECEIMAGQLQKCRERGGTVLLDSGNYEKSRNGDASWRFPRFLKSVERTPHDFVLSFDKLNPRGSIDKVVQGIVSDARRDAAATGSDIIPIVHLPQKANGDYKIEMAPEIAFGIAAEFKPLMLAIPERELGSGIFARVATMAAIRAELNKLYRYVPVHILGTGNPTSIALLTASGADSFDGLEWCRFVVDAEKATLHHFHHYDFYEYQAALAESPVTSVAANDPKVHFGLRTVLHNLDFYQDWMHKLRVAVREDRQLIAFVAGILPKGSMPQARKALPHLL